MRAGLAFEGNKYEGLVSGHRLSRSVRGTLDQANLDQPANLKALKFLHDRGCTPITSPRRAVPGLDRAEKLEERVSLRQGLRSQHNGPNLLGLDEAKWIFGGRPPGYAVPVTKARRGHPGQRRADASRPAAPPRPPTSALVKWLRSPHSRRQGAIESGGTARYERPTPPPRALSRARLTSR